MSDTLQEREDEMSHDHKKELRINATDDWCDDCQGYIHAPWCPSYLAVDEVSNEEYQQLTTEHQPAARGGGDEWRYIETSGSAEIRIGQITLRPHWTGLADGNQIRELFQQIITEHNQHHSLMAERERLQQQNERLLKALRSTAHNAADGSGLCWCAADDRVFGHQTKCTQLRRVLNEQRSTSE